jgi:hypothetical protein
VFLLATALRLVFLYAADQPLLYTHQYTYFTNAMRIAESAEPVSYILHSEEWRTWDDVWTIAPLYFVFLGAALKAAGLHLFPVLLLQCLMGGATAAGVAAIGRDLAGRAGVWAGVLYALYGPAMEMPSTTMTENLHTPLLVWGLWLAARAADAPSSRRRAAVAGVVIGLSALTRSVSTGFLGLAGLYFVARHRKAGLVPAACLFAGGAVMILPWTARNVFIIRDPILIESAAFENIWYANSVEDPARRERQVAQIHEQESPAERRRIALHFALRGIERHPDLFFEKVRANFWHFVRPEGLQNLLAIERSQETWRHAFAILLDDALFFPALPLFAVFLVAGSRAPARALIAIWTSYYLFMLVVVFHNEIRYRSGFAPFLFAGAVAGLHLFRKGEKSAPAWTAGGLALGIAVVSLAPYAPLAARAVQASVALRPALRSADEGRGNEALTLAEPAAACAPGSPRPWLTLGGRLLGAGDADAARRAYERGQKTASPANWTPRLARAWLAREGTVPDAEAALTTVHALSWSDDPWLALEVAWRELPAPVGDDVALGDDDYGAARGFLHPRGGDPEIARARREWNQYERMGTELPPPGTHRWSRHRAWLRLRPKTTAARYTATLWMGTPFPSRLDSARVAVRAGAGAQEFELGRDMRPYTFDAVADAHGVVRVQLDAPTWCRTGEPADQGVRVDRLALVPSPSR